MCQAIFTMKNGRKYAIMCNVNKTVFMLCGKLNILYKMHKTSFVFLLKPKMKGERFHV